VHVVRRLHIFVLTEKHLIAFKQNEFKGRPEGALQC